jgi:predicted ATPase
MEALRGALDAALTGKGGVALLAGEPGIGKTCTAEELAAYARERGARVLWGRCHEGDGAPAFWPWIQILRSYLRDRDPELLAAIGPVADDIARLVPGPWFPGTTSGDADTPTTNPGPRNPGSARRDPLPPVR